MANLIHFRIAVYLITLITHSVNCLLLSIWLFTDSSKEQLFEDLKISITTFYTGWNIGYQIIYAALGLYSDLSVLKNNGGKCTQINYKIVQFKKIFFETILWPSSLMVFCEFWTVYFYNRDVLYPTQYDKMIPLTSNFIIHGAVLAVVLWEVFAQPRTEPKSHKRNLLITIGSLLIYVAWISIVNAIIQLWPYPFIYLIAGSYKFYVCLSFEIMVISFFYWIQWPITRLIWGDLDKKK